WSITADIRAQFAEHVWVVIHETLQLGDFRNGQGVADKLTLPIARDLLGLEDKHRQRPEMEQQVLFRAADERNCLGIHSLRAKPERARNLGRMESVLLPGLFHSHKVFPGIFPLFAMLAFRALLERNARLRNAAWNGPEHVAPELEPAIALI